MKKIFLCFPLLTGPLRSYYNYLFGEKEIGFLYKFLKKNKEEFNFFDIGANYGVYTFLLGKKAKRVFVFEPIRECVEYIKSGYNKNNIVFINKILSDNNDKKVIHIPIEKNRKVFGRSSVDNKFYFSEKRTLPSISLDQFIENIEFNNDLLSVIKIDCEGHELKVLEGALNFLNNTKLILLIEIEKRHNPLYQHVFKTLIDLKFDVFIVKNKKLKSLKNLKEIEKFMEQENNFLFKNF